MTDDLDPGKRRDPFDDPVTGDQTLPDQPPARQPGADLAASQAAERRLAHGPPGRDVREARPGPAGATPDPSSRRRVARRTRTRRRSGTRPRGPGVAVPAPRSRRRGPRAPHRVRTQPRARATVLGDAARPCGARVASSRGDAQGDARDRRPRGHDHQPRQGLLPAGRAHQARPRPLLPRGRRRGAARRPRPADGAQALRRRRREGAVLPEARARRTARRGIRTATLTFPSGRTADEVVARRRRRASPGSPTSAASTSTRTRSAPTTSTTPTSCAWTSTRCPACPGRRCATWRWSPGGARGRRARRLAEDLRLARDPHQRPDRAALDLRRGPPGGAGAGPRRGAAGARRSPPRKWWKEERHGVFLDYNQNAKDRTVASAYSVRPDARRPGLVPAPLGRGARRRSWRTSRSRRCPRSTRERGDAGAGIDEAVGLAGGAAGAVRPPRGRGRGRRPVAAELREAGGRAAAGPAVEEAPRRQRSTRAAARTAGRRRRSPRSGPRPSRPATRTPACPTEWQGSTPSPTGRRKSNVPVVEIGRAPTKAEVYDGLERWKARHPEAARVPGARGRDRDRDARPGLRLVPAPGQPHPRPGGAPAGAGGARPGRRARRLGEPLRRRAGGVARGPAARAARPLRRTDRPAEPS